MQKLKIACLVLLCFFLIFTMPFPFKKQTISATANDFILTRPVNVNVDGRYILLDSIAEEKGTYDFPCYTAWSYTSNVEYKTGLNIFSNREKKIEAKRKARKLAKAGLKKKIEESSYPVLIKVYNSATDRWDDYKKITIHGKEGITID